MPEKILELPAIKESTVEFEAMEKRIKEAFKREFFGPLLHVFGLREGSLQNARVPKGLAERIGSARIIYRQGAFTGKFDAESTKELKELGAVWDEKIAGFRLPKSKLPAFVKAAIAQSDVKFQAQVQKFEKFITQQNLPAKIADSIRTGDLFVRSAEKVNGSISKTLKGLSVVPELSAKEKEKIAEEWQNNMDLWIKNFTEEQIVKLRKDVAMHVAQGGRVDELRKMLQHSYGVTERKAKFLARQETGLLMAKFKETRYTSANVNEYRWSCVAGSKNHPVRPSHKILDGKIFRFDTPPITTPQGEPVRRNNPGQDYNCRCFARPIVRF